MMDVWDPKDKDVKTAVFSQIKKLISAPYRVLKTWVVRLDPGNKPKNLTNEEWKLMTRFSEDMAWLVGTLFVLCLIAWITKDVI
jgi:hypothetical protein|tara:strand:+ start:184 stop:435 length:252 start_codon:yes stop_codon:yes gene_type:complete